MRGWRRGEREGEEGVGISWFSFHNHKQREDRAERSKRKRIERGAGRVAGERSGRGREGELVAAERTKKKRNNHHKSIENK